MSMDPDIPAPPLSEASRVWLRIGLLSFGGPAGQIAMMHRMLVTERSWIDEDRFLHALNYCMLLPGPEAQQLATYIGWLMHRTVGGLIAGLLFILPGALVMLGLSIAYVLFSDLRIVDAAFAGIKSAVLIIVVDAVIRIGRRALVDRTMIAVAILAFLAIAVFAVPFPVIIACAAGLGALFAGDPRQTARTPGTGPGHTRPSLGRAVILILIFGVLWFGPIALLYRALGPDHVLAQQAIFFSKLAVVTFGGAYAVLAYMAQQAVEAFGWVTPEEMLDGLGLAETTPGPLILVTQFVGFLGAHRHAADADALWSGVLGTAVTLWVTFTPCFLWILLGAPYVERLRNNRRLAAALSGITAAVVGVVLNLAFWFALHVNFMQLVPVDIPGVALMMPIPESVDPVAVSLTLVAAAMMLWWRQGLIRTLLACAALGMLSTVV